VRDGDQRKMMTQGTNVVLAKNRYGLPAELPLSWDALMAAMAAASTSSIPVKEGEKTNG